MQNNGNSAAFVTYGWNRSAYAFVRSLGQRGIAVDVGDESRLAMSRFSRYARSFTVLPDFFAHPEEYFDLVIATMRERGARVLLPCHEDVGIFARRRDRIPPEIGVALPPFESYELAEDKYAVLELARKAGCGVPESRLVDPFEDVIAVADELGWPVVIKTRVGNSAKGVAIAHNPVELRHRFDDLVDRFELPYERWPFLQSFLPGKPVGVCAIFDHGRCAAIFGEEYLRTKEGGLFGTSTLRRTLHDDVLFADACRVLEALHWHGVAHLDFIADPQGRYRLIEVNPRPWGAIWLAVAAGVDFPYLWYLLASGEPLPESQAPSNGAYCRWILGDLLAALTLLRRGEMGRCLAVFRPERRCMHDDFYVADPLPLLFESADYSIKAVRARETNPVKVGMVR
jgi:predicted ATP-grasp superfamily ATP-dependent carboligase